MWVRIGPRRAQGPADGAIGAHFDAVRKAFDDFQRLAKEIAGRVGLDLQ